MKTPHEIDAILLTRNTDPILREKGQTRLLKQYKDLIFFCAIPFQRQGLPIDDLYQEGAMGFLHAIDRFDLRYEVKIMTYAIPFIRKAIRRALDNQGHLIRKPVHVLDHIRKLKKENSLQDLSLHIPIIYMDQNPKRHEKMESFTKNPHDVYLDEINDNLVESMLSNLDGLPLEIIKYRYGLSGYPESSIWKTAVKLNISKLMVHEVEEKTIELLKKQFKGAL